jgi:hypothetical protein
LPSSFRQRHSKGGWKLCCDGTSPGGSSARHFFEIALFSLPAIKSDGKATPHKERNGAPGNEWRIQEMQATDSKSQANAAWMEHEILNHVKQALRVTLGWKVPLEGIPRKLSSVQFTLKSFQRHLERLMDIEEQDGYMTFVGELKPNMHFRIDRLEHDHHRFRRAMDSLVPKVDSISEFNEREIEAVCGEIYELLDKVDHHDKEEIDLLQESMWCDEGGEG